MATVPAVSTESIISANCCCFPSLPAIAFLICSNISRLSRPSLSSFSSAVSRGPSSAKVNSASFCPLLFLLASVVGVSTLSAMSRLPSDGGGEIARGGDLVGLANVCSGRFLGALHGALSRLAFRWIGRRGRSLRGETEYFLRILSLAAFIGDL